MASLNGVAVLPDRVGFSPEANPSAEDFKAVVLKEPRLGLAHRLFPPTLALLSLPLKGDSSLLVLDGANLKLV